MSVTALIEMDNAAEHIFDPIFLELANDRGRMKSQVLSSEVFFSNYDTDGDAISKRGAKTIAFSGVNNTASVSGGVLKFINDRSLATYSGITSIINDFAFRCRVEPIVLTVPNDRYLVTLKSTIDLSEVRFYLQNQGGGVTRIKRKIINSTGTTVHDLIIGSRNFSIVPSFNIAFSNDGAGNTLTYLDGVLISTVASPAFNFTDMDIIFGENSSGKASSANFDNVQLFSSNAITSSFPFPLPEPTTYSLLEHIMATKIPLTVDQIISFSVLSQIPSDTELKHAVSLDGDRYVHNGTVWVIADSVADLMPQANTLAEIQANFTTLPIIQGIGKTIEIVHVFKSISGYGTPEIESVTMKYFRTFKSGNVPLCVVSGTIRDNLDVPVVGAKVWVQGLDKFVNNVFIGPAGKVLTNAQGKYSISVPETATDGTSVDFTIEYLNTEPGGATETQEYIQYEIRSRVIPNLPTADMDALLELQV